MPYDPTDLSRYLDSIRGSIDDPAGRVNQIPSFTNISSIADTTGAFDVRSDEERFLDDLKQEQKSQELEQKATQATSVRSSQLSEINDPDTLHQMRTTAVHEYTIKKQADYKAIDEAEQIPMFDTMLTTIMGSGGNFQADPNYITVYNQRQAAIMRADTKKKELAPRYEDSLYYINQIEDRMAKVQPVWDMARKAEALQTDLRIRVETNKGIIGPEIEAYATILDKTPEDLVAADYQDFNDDRANFIDSYTKGQKYTASEVATYHPDSLNDFLKLEAAKKSTKEIEVQSQVKEWDKKAEEATLGMSLTKEEQQAALARGEKPENTLTLKKVGERVKVIEEEKQKFKAKNTKVADLSLDNDPTATDIDKRSADFIIGYMNKTLDGRNIYDVGAWEVFLFTQEVIMASQYKDDIHTGTKLNNIARRMFRNLISDFNAKYATSIGVSLSTEDFAMWGVQP